MATVKRFGETGEKQVKKASKAVAKPKLPKIKAWGKGK